MKYETTDGWDLENIPPLLEAEEAIKELSRIAYELNMCVRTRSLQKMRDDLILRAQEIIDAVSEIGDEDELVEKSEEEEE